MESRSKDLEDLLKENRYELAAHIPAQGWARLDDEELIRFTYEKLLVRNSENNRFKFLAMSVENNSFSSRGLSSALEEAKRQKDWAMLLPEEPIRKLEKILYHSSETPIIDGGISRIFLGQLAESGMGKLYLTYHLYYHEIQVIKVAKDDSMEEELKREARWLKEFRGLPGFVQSRGYSNQILKIRGEIKKAIVMEHCDVTIEEMLDNYLRRHNKAIKNGQASEYMNDCLYLVTKSLLQIVNTLNEKKVVYRDLKLDNLMLKTKNDGSLECKLIDFGTTLTDEEARRNPNIAFTPHTTEPEALFLWYYTRSFMNKEELIRADDEMQGDIYSLGRCLMEFLGKCLDVPIGNDPKRDYNSLLQSAEDQNRIIPKLMLWNSEELQELRHKNEEARMFNQWIFNFIEELTKVRTERAHIYEIGFDDESRECTVKKNLRCNIDEEKVYFNLKPENQKDFNLKLAENLLKILDHLEETHKNEQIYLAINYDNKTGKAILSKKIYVDDVKRMPSDFYEFDYVHCEPESLIPYFAACAIAGYADGEINQNLMKSRRFDKEIESNHYSLGRILVHALSDYLGIQEGLLQQNPETDRFLEEYLIKIKMCGQVDLAENEPIRKLHEAHQKDIDLIERINIEYKDSARQLFPDNNNNNTLIQKQHNNHLDSGFFSIARDLTKYRMERRISLQKAKTRLKEIEHKYHS